MVTLEELKGYLQIPDSVTTYDVKLNFILGGAIEKVRNYCGRHFTRATTTERIKLRGGFGFLTNTPLVSISSVIDDFGNTVTASIIDESTGQVEVPFLTNRYYKFIYDGGMAEEDIPSDLKLSIMQLCEFMYNNQPGIQQFSISGYSTKTQVNESGIPLIISSVLNSYKHTRMWG